MISATGPVRLPRRPSAWAEVALIAALYAAYSVTRVLVNADPATAMANGHLVLAVERAWGLDVEAAAVNWLVDSTVLSVLAGYLYALLHYTVTPAVLVWVYRVHPEQYRSARLVLLGATSIALVCYFWVPTAPPRLLSDAYPDVLALTAQWGWWGAEASAPRGLGSLTNQYAALPSMHVGWAAWCGLMVAVLARRLAVRVAAVAYPVLVTVIVVATGNHYLLDAVAGAALVLGVFALGLTASRAPRLVPVRAVSRGS
jgi:hypothetical protein